MKKIYQTPHTLIFALTGTASLLAASGEVVITVSKDVEIEENFSRHHSVGDDEGDEEE